MGSLMRKGLISIAAAGLLSTAALATQGIVDHTDAADFRIVPATNSITVGKKVIISLDLLKADGSLDIGESLYGNTVTAKCVATLGTCQDATVNNGHAFIVVNENALGTDQVSISVLIKDAEGDVKILPAKSIEIGVVPPANKAKGLEIISYQSLVDQAHAFTYEGNYSKTPDQNLSAGEGFTVKVEAIKSDDTTADDAQETAQNSPVKVRVIDSEKEVVGTFAGQMNAGVAYVTVPNETVTKVGCYNLQALAPTDNTEAVKIDGNYTAISQTYEVCFNPLDAKKLSVVSSNPYIYKLTDKDKNATITVCLADKYGNIVENKGQNSVVVTLDLNDKDAFTINLDQLTIQVNDDCEEANLSVKDRDLLSLTSAKTATVTATADDLDSGSISVKAYKARLASNTELNGATNILDTTDVILESDISADSNSTKAGNPFRFAKDDTPFKIFAQEENTVDNNVSINGKSIKVIFPDNFTAPNETVSTVVESSDNDRNQSFAVRLKKAAKYDSFRIEYADSDKAYAPLEVTLDRNISVIAADPEKIEVYGGTIEGKYIKVEKSDLPQISNITVDLNQNETAFFDANETNVTTAGLSNLYLVALEDTYGNAIKQGTVSLNSQLLSETKSLELNGSNLAEFNYSSVTPPKTDTISITAALVDPKDIGVKVVNNKPVLHEVEAVLIKNSVIRGSYIPLSIKAYDQFDKLMDDAIVQVVISDPTKIAIYEINASGELPAEISTGGDLNSSKTYVIKGVNLGSTSITLRNVAGTVTDTKDVNVVAKVASETPSEVNGSVDIVAGKWNLITTPVPANMPKSKLDTFTSKTVWAFDSAAYHYVAASSEIEVGKGYWVKADKQGGTLTYSAVPTVADKAAQWTLIQNNLVAGKWNLIGTSFDTTKTEIKNALGVNSVWPYDPAAGQYSTAENITAGHGMWVK